MYSLFNKRKKVVDLSYGGERGFNQPIELSCEYLDNVKFIQEKRLLGKYFEEMSNDTKFWGVKLEIKGKYVNVECELKEMHARYSQLSLQFAEVEGER